MKTLKEKEKEGNYLERIRTVATTARTKLNAKKKKKMVISMANSINKKLISYLLTNKIYFIFRRGG